VGDIKTKTVVPIKKNAWVNKKCLLFKNPKLLLQNGRKMKTAQQYLCARCIFTRPHKDDQRLQKHVLPPIYLQNSEFSLVRREKFLKFLLCCKFNNWFML